MSTDEILRCLRRLDVSIVVADSTCASSVQRAAARYGKLEVKRLTSSFIAYSVPRIFAYVIYTIELLSAVTLSGAHRRRYVYLWGG